MWYIIIQYQSLCDSLLDVRIRIQKAVNIANQFPQYDVFSYFNDENEEAEKKVNETKKETLNLINELLDLREVWYILIESLFLIT